MQVKWLSSVCTILVAVSEDNLYSSHPVSDISPRGSWRAKVVKILDNAKKQIRRRGSTDFVLICFMAVYLLQTFLVTLNIFNAISPERNGETNKTKIICCQKNLCHWSHYLALGRVPELRLETVLQIGWAFIHIFPSYLLISFVFVFVFVISFVFVFVFVSVFCICVIGNRFANWPSGRIYADNPHFWLQSLFDRPPLTYWLYNRTSIAPPFSPRSLHHNHPSSSSSVAIV